VEKLQNFVGCSEFEFHPASLFLCDQTGLKAFHSKSDGCCCRDCIDSVGITIEVELLDEIPVKTPHIGASAGCFVLRSIHADLLSLVRSCFELEVVGDLCTGHGTALPAGVGLALSEVPLLQDFRIDLKRVRVRTELVIMNWKEVVLIHDLNDIGRSNLSDSKLMFVQSRHLGINLHAVITDDTMVKRLVDIVHYLNGPGWANICA